jgi:hypothetical protein
MFAVDVRGMERELRKLTGVVSCAIADGVVTVLLSEDADAAAVAKEATAIAGAFGASSVRVLESPLAIAAARKPARPFVLARPRVAAGTAVAAALALIATIVPIGRKVAPRVSPPAAFRPAPAPANAPLAAVIVPGPGAPARAARTRTVVAAPPGSSQNDDGSTTIAPRGPVTGSPARPAAPQPAPAPSNGGCREQGKAVGRANHEGPGNRSWHRHHSHADAHDHEHWFDCG